MPPDDALPRTTWDDTVEGCDDNALAVVLYLQWRGLAPEGRVARAGGGLAPGADPWVLVEDDAGEAEEARVVQLVREHAFGNTGRIRAARFLARPPGQRGALPLAAYGLVQTAEVPHWTRMPACDGVAAHR